MLGDTCRNDVPRLAIPASYAGQNDGVRGILSAGAVEMADVFACVDGHAHPDEIVPCLEILKRGHRAVGP